MVLKINKLEQHKENSKKILIPRIKILFHDALAYLLLMPVTCNVKYFQCNYIDPPFNSIDV